MRAVSKLVSLTAPRLIEKINERASQIEARLVELRAALEPLKEHLDSIMDSLRHLRVRIGEAERVMIQGSNRAKAEALRGCISRIECRYDTSGRRAVLSEVTITPQVGEPQQFEVASDTVFNGVSTGLHARV